MHFRSAENFRDHQIVRSSGMRLKSLFDFLPYMDRADLVVSVETSFLHLSAATKTPVIAMVTNLPSHWHGTAWSKRFAFHCRYNDFGFRKDELIAAANRAVNGHDTVQPEIYLTQRQHGYNMSISKDAVVYRYHPYGDWRTKLVYEIGRAHV